MRFVSLIVLILLLCPSGLLAADPAETLHETLQQENQRADEKEMKVRELTQKAGNISTRLSDIEDDIKTLKKRISSQEKVLKEIRENEQKAREDHFALEKQKQQITMELSGLMQALWPVHLQNVRARFKGVDSWAMFDRRFNWLAGIYEATQSKLEEARINSQHIARNLERQRLLESEAELQLEEINKNKDRLLGNKYALRKNLRTIRKQRQSLESELSDILATIQELKYQLQSRRPNGSPCTSAPCPGRSTGGWSRASTPMRSRLSGVSS